MTRIDICKSDGAVIIGCKIILTPEQKKIMELESKVATLSRHNDKLRRQRDYSVAIKREKEAENAKLLQQRDAANAQLDFLIEQWREKNED